MGDAGFEPVGVTMIRQAAPTQLLGPGGKPQLIEVPVVVMKKAVECERSEVLSAFDKFTDLEKSQQAKV